MPSKLTHQNSNAVSPDVDTEGDLDSAWQLVDIDVTLQPIRSQLSALDAQFCGATNPGDSRSLAEAE